MRLNIVVVQRLGLNPHAYVHFISHHHHRPNMDQPGHCWSAQCSNQCNLSIKAHPLHFLTQVIHCCIRHSNGTLAGPDLVGGGGACSYMLLLHPAPTCPDAGLGLYSFCWCVFPSISWCKYSTCMCGGHHLLQLMLVVFFLPATGAHTPLVLVQLALHGGGCM